MSRAVQPPDSRPKPAPVTAAAAEAEVTQPAAAGRSMLLDAIRGFTLLQMIVYHAFWNLDHLFKVELPWFDGSGAYIWQQSICWTFILLAGFCWPLGKRPLKRGLTLAAAGAAITLATTLATPAEPIFFGVLTLLSLCTLLLLPLDRLLRRVPPAAGLAASGALFVLTRNVNEGQLGFAGWEIAALPPDLYGGWSGAFLGFPGPEFYSADYFPLLPWLFLFGAGYFLCRLRPNGPPRRYIPGASPLACLGRHSLPVYLLHQPLLYAGCRLFFSFI